MLAPLSQKFPSCSSSACNEAARLLYEPINRIDWKPPVGGDTKLLLCKEFAIRADLPRESADNEMRATRKKGTTTMFNRRLVSHLGAHRLLRGAALPLAMLLVMSTGAQAQHFTTLYTFVPGSEGGPGPGGGIPLAGVVRDAAGNLYGSTVAGGLYNPQCTVVNPLYGSCGVVFKVDTFGHESALYSFAGSPDGGFADQGSLTLDAAGNLYGTRSDGGDLNACGGIGCGTVFKLDTEANLTVLHTFEGDSDGARPSGTMVQDAAGNLFGTTDYGGPYPGGCGGGGCGVVFKIDASGNFSVLYAFSGSTDGGVPEGGLVIDSAGDLYGTTSQAGDVSCTEDGWLPWAGCGVVFKVDSAGTETVLHTFEGLQANDGATPKAGLVLDASGDVYGTTYYGGSVNCVAVRNQTHYRGCGIVFEIDTTGNEHVLYIFANGPIGYGIGYAPSTRLVLDGQGNLYGTTEKGGGPQEGTVFELSTAGQYTVLHSFGLGDAPGLALNDGAEPMGDLILDSAGNLYGTTYANGDISCYFGDGCGTVFKIEPH